MYKLMLPLLLLQASAAYTQKVTETGRVIPTAAKTDFIQHANNNLDVTAFGGGYYLAFRTAPSHFASKKSQLVVMRTQDLEHYVLDTLITCGADVREPRFCVKGDSLLLYYFEGGTHLFKFEPKKIWAVAKTTRSGWSLPIDQHLDGFVPWRVRNIDGTLYLSAYLGVGLYGKDHRSDLRLFSSRSGMDWKPVSEAPQCDLPYAEEGEFIADKTGDLWGTIRFEGYGGALFHADKTDWGKWTLYPTDDKYDSALLFGHKDDLYLVARRNIPGRANRFKSRKRNLLHYSLTRKCTALYKINREAKTVDHVLDFESTGDNAYAGIIQTGADEYLVFNYSSDPKHKKNWIRGQLGRTNIYTYRLVF